MSKRKKANPLEQALTQTALLERAGDRYFKRGETYFRQGYVNDLALDGDGVTAVVMGTEDYDVELWAEDGSLQASCTCPLGVDEIFCKHCVAVGLSWLANPDAVKTKPDPKTTDQPVTSKDVRNFLEQQKKETLLEWILERLIHDENWKQQMFLKVASQRPQGLDITTFQRALRNAIVVRDFIDWNQVSHYADQIGAVYDSIQNLLESYPQSVMELCEEAIVLLEVALNSIDDSSGGICQQE
jgi:uncharacterized Zn finger protein